MHRLRPAVLGVLLLAALTACTSPAPAPTPTGTTTPSSTPSSTPSADASPTSSTAGATPSSPGSGGTPSASASSAAASDPNRPSGQCADAVIKVSLSMPKGAAGSFVQDLLLTNSGATPCVLRGAPGLSVVGGGDGAQLGSPAFRDQTGATTVRLAAHGGQVYAPFTGPELGPGTEGAKHCTAGVRSGDGYRVYPPHSTRAVFVRDADAVACPSGGSFLRIGVVRPVGTE